LTTSNRPRSRGCPGTTWLGRTNTSTASRVPRAEFEATWREGDAARSPQSPRWTRSASQFQLDEPTSGLDARLADELVEGALTAAGERSVMVTHRAAEAARCDAAVALEAGHVVQVQD